MSHNSLRRNGGGFYSKEQCDVHLGTQEKSVHIEKDGSSSGVAVPIQDQEQPSGAVAFTELFRFATKFELAVDFIGLTAAVGAGAALPLMALLFGNLLNAFVTFGTTALRAGSDPVTFEAAADHFRHVAAKDALLLTVTGLGTFAATYTYMYIWVYTGEVMAKRVRELYLRAILRQDIAFFDHVGAGEVATRIQTDTHLFQQGTSEKAALVVNYLSTFCCGLVLAYAKSWRLALAMSSVAPCLGIAGAVMNKFVSKYSNLSRDAVAEGGTLAEEVISTVRTAQAFGTQSMFAALYDNHASRSLTLDAKAAVFHGCGLGAFLFVIYSSYGVSFSFGTTLILWKLTDPGTIVTVIIAMLFGSYSLALMAPERQAISHAQGAATKLFATIDRVPPIDSASCEGLQPRHVEGRIDVEKVEFSYPSRPNVPILKEISITFEAGKTVALVGASGSGKSTIVSLVERFYDPLAGSVKLDGRDLRDLNVKWLRRQIGLVSQEPTLFATTIEENVAHGLIGTKWEAAPREEKFRLIKEACIMANADDFISALQNGYQTMVGERGILLSGGQKQRIAIARAIVSNPRILLLDEATSALDTQSEGIVQNALDRAAAGRTTITVAHRLSTIKAADRIYVMGEGVVLEQGTHEQLLANTDGPYARLVRAQKLRELDEGDADDETPGETKKEFATMTRMRKKGTLKRRDTGKYSLASVVLEKLDAEDMQDGQEDKQRSLAYLFMRMGKINRDTWPMYASGAVFAMITGMVYPLFSIVYGHAIQLFVTQDGHQLRGSQDRNALWFFIIAVLSMFAIACQNYLFAKAASRLTFKLRSLSFKAILRKDTEFFDENKNSTGSVTSSLGDNPEKVNGLAGITLGAMIQCFSCLIGGAIVGLAYGWKLALVGIACMPLIISTGIVRLRVVVLKDKRNKVAHEASARLACEAAASIRTVASLTREDDFCAQYSECLLVPLRNSNRAAIWSSFLYSLSQAVAFFVISVAFWYGSRLVASREYTTKQFFTCMMTTVFATMQASNVFSYVPDISSAEGAANDIINLLDSTPEIDTESPNGQKPENVMGHIRFEEVYFRYPTRPGVRVLRGLNFEVKPGTFVALVGASGCGKSTIIQLIERFYDPRSGQIYLDDQLISDLNVQEYRKHISLVSQEPTLYAGTVRFNILLGAVKPMNEVTQDEIEAACRDANILEFIKSLPDGFETQVGSKGSQLSGGQKQRIAIARALLRKPKVLLLDEATSALDSNSERVVQRALDQAVKGRTTIAIAHRLSTIQNADHIFFIKKGRVSESGTHDQLLALRGGYYEYVQLQGLNEK